MKRPYKRGHVELNCVELASDRVQLRTYSFFAHQPPVSKITTNLLSSSVPARCLKKHLGQEHQRLLPQPHFSFTYWIKTAKGEKRGIPFIRLRVAFVLHELDFLSLCVRDVSSVVL